MWFDCLLWPNLCSLLYPFNSLFFCMQLLAEPALLNLDVNEEWNSTWAKQNGKGQKTHQTNKTKTTTTTPQKKPTKLVHCIRSTLQLFLLWETMQLPMVIPKPGKGASPSPPLSHQAEQQRGNILQLPLSFWWHWRFTFVPWNKSQQIYTTMDSCPVFRSSLGFAGWIFLPPLN